MQASSRHGPGGVGLGLMVLAGWLLLVGAVWGSGPREVSPQEGDGIYVLLRRHGFSPTHAEVEAFVQLNQDRLGPDRALRLDRSYRLPARGESGSAEAARSGSRVHYPLFGSRYEWVERKSTRLSGCVLYLISGHGGPDPGAIGQRDGRLLAEDEYAYDITLRLARVLLEQGADITMIVRDENDGIRDDLWLEMDRDEVVHPNLKIPLNQTERLRQRAEVVNRLYAQRADPDGYHRVIEIHLDSRSLDQRVDVFFYHHANSPLGRRLAHALRDTFDTKYRQHQPGRGYRGTVSARSLYMLNRTQPPAVFIELGNIRNRHNQFRFIQPANRQALAEWIADGIRRDFETHR